MTRQCHSQAFAEDALTAPEGCGATVFVTAAQRKPPHWPRYGSPDTGFIHIVKNHSALELMN